MRVAVIDDEFLMRDLIKTSLIRLGHRVDAFSEGNSCLQKYKPGDYDLVITDLKLPGLTGIEVSEALLTRDPHLAVIVMTAYGTIDTAVEAIKKGVSDFIEKPFQVEKLEHLVSRVQEMKGLKKENSRLKENMLRKYQTIGKSQPLVDLMDQIRQVAASKSTVLIAGESGTGKELIAHAIHAHSPRCSDPLIKVNCAAIPDTLIESELFGHEKGAYTGAIKTRVGKFELANTGTILLDEIGEMPLFSQTKLLRILQEKEISKVGGDEIIDLDVRVICTTNRDLEEEVKKGEFREDLFYRLNVIQFQVPPLRERKEDIPLLCEHFIQKYNDENGFHVTTAKEASLKKLMAHDWPGNVRELENAVQRAVVYAKYGEIEESHIQLSDRKSAVNGSSFYPGMTVADGEKQLILNTLKACGNNRTKASEMLDISVRTLRNKLNEYHIKEV